jgi:peroxiredoxin family protein
MHSDLQRLTIIQTKGSLDWAYPPLILASSAVAMGRESSIFFSHYGVRLLLKETSGLRVTPVGNPAMPMRLNLGPRWLAQRDLRPWTPDLLWALPGMTRLATWAFKRHMAASGQLSFEALRALCLEMGVEFVVCQSSLDLLGFREADLIDGLTFAGAATYLATSAPDQALFI